MNRSWKDYPKGKFPSIDGLRQRMQNLMDLQRSLANTYMSFTYSDNRGREFWKISRSPAAWTSLRTRRLTQRPEVPQASVHDVAVAGNVSDVVKELRLQEMAFSAEIIGAGDTCGI